ncbi:outer membrane protein transport protein [Desulfococcaceae bacterium HSG8]|nr:outer membrane protein transport protein [Desulfococcaceae bacterium HSG8]
MNFASSPNPVGSGARALGMGGAFIGVADDATAASWNPGGLVQLKAPEISFVGNWLHRIEDNTFGGHPEANGAQTISKEDLNYFSVAYPFHLFNRNMIVSLNYQNLYDFTREWSFPIIHESKPDAPLKFTSDSNNDYQQNGTLSALGIACSAQIVPNFFFGFTLNLWDDDLSNNKWEENYRFSVLKITTWPVISTTNEINHWKDRYLFSGFNFNIGMLWHVTNELTIGMVFKSPFTADVKHERITIQEKVVNSQEKEPGISHYNFNEKLDMPMSYGLGIAYRFSDEFTVSADIYRTEWQDFILTEQDGTEKSFITGKPAEESDIDPTHQFRMGAEYMFIKSDYTIPLRAGAFYDPVPAEGSPDDYYGVSMGAGIAIGRYLFDIACQYRFGNDVGDSIVQDADFSHYVDEYMVYSSLIIHF